MILIRERDRDREDEGERERELIDIVTILRLQFLHCFYSKLITSGIPISSIITLKSVRLSQIYLSPPPSSPTI